MENRNTTLLTLFGVTAGLLNTLAISGLHIPQTKQELASFGVSMLLAASGYLAQGTETKK